MAHRLQLTVATGDALDVRRFALRDAVSSLFDVSVWALCANDAIDLEGVVGKPASLLLETGFAFAPLGGTRLFKGICNYVEQVRAEPTGLSTYFFRIVPDFWLLTQRRNYKVFQHIAIPDIVDQVFTDWTLAHTWKIDRPKYPKLEYKVQYGESDYDFVSRLLEEAGIAFYFPDDGGAGTSLTLGDNLHGAAPRGAPLGYLDKPDRSLLQEWVTAVRIAHDVRPGAFTLRDYDFRNPNFPLFGEAPKALPPEDKYEQYHYRPGSFLVEGAAGGNTPFADDKGTARHEQKAGADRAERGLAAERAPKRMVSFEANNVDYWPGMVLSIDAHPHADLDKTPLLAVGVSMEGTHDTEWSIGVDAVLANVPFRPAWKTRKPEVGGVQSATVVGPSGQEIHTDEFGRVRVQFPWDRLGKNDDNSSCWMRVSQGWAGTGFGLLTIPRIGQEVLVGFLEADPDQPIIVGRVFNSVNQVPYKLPDHKTRSTWKSDSSPNAEGFNEVMFEDLADKELIFIQAQKNLRKLVKNNETITIGHNRQKLVKANETETTGGARTEVVGSERVEITVGNRTTVIGSSHAKLVKFDENERIEKDQLFFAGKDQHTIVKHIRREQVCKDSHLRVMGQRNEQIDGTDSLSCGGHQEKVGGKFALGAEKEIHVKAGTAVVIEAVADLTFKAPGGFVRIDGGGVTIVGSLVRINSGGSAGTADDASPASPSIPREAKVVEPKKPDMDDVSKTGIGQ